MSNDMEAVRQQRKMQREANLAVKRKFAKIDRLNKLVDEQGAEAPEARKTKRSLNEFWNRRRSHNVRGFWKPDAAFAD